MQTYCVVFLLTQIFAQDTIVSLSFDGDMEVMAKQLISNSKIDLVNNEGVNGSSCISISYIGNNRGSEKILEELYLSKPMIEATLSYDIMFDSAFDFAAGGKLPGLGPLNQVTGGNRMKPDGWSARLMFKSKGHISSYIYHQNKKQNFGGGKRSNTPVFIPGKSHHVDLYVKVNDEKQKNGAFSLWVDQELILQHKNLEYRKICGDSTLINKVLFHTFFGGNSIRYAPRDSSGKITNTLAYFDNIYVFKGNQRERNLTNPNGSQR